MPESKPAAKKSTAKKPAAKKPAAKKPAAKKTAQRGGLGYDPSQQIGYDPTYDNNMDDYDRRMGMYGSMNVATESDAVRAWRVVASALDAVVAVKPIKKQTVMGGDNCKVDRMNASMKNASKDLTDFIEYYRPNTVSLQGKREEFGRVSMALNTIRLMIIADVYYSKTCGSRLDEIRNVISLLTGAVRSFSALAKSKTRLLTMSGIETDD